MWENGEYERGIKKRGVGLWGERRERVGVVEGRGGGKRGTRKSFCVLMGWGNDTRPPPKKKQKLYPG